MNYLYDIAEKQGFAELECLETLGNSGMLETLENLEDSENWEDSEDLETLETLYLGKEVTPKREILRPFLGTGTVVRIHPLGRFVTLEFCYEGGCFRESFLLPLELHWEEELWSEREEWVAFA